MNIPASDHFTTVDLQGSYNANRGELPPTLSTPDHLSQIYGGVQFRGIPFAFGPENAPNVIHLREQAVEVEMGGVTATYFLFVHAVEDITTSYRPDLADDPVDGNTLGTSVSDYVIDYEDGERLPAPIVRRFSIQQSRIAWGASPFAAVPTTRPEIFMSTTEAQELGRMPEHLYGEGETRTSSGRDATSGLLWIYALPNPYPQKTVNRIILEPQSEESCVYAISHTSVQDHPLRPEVRRKLRLSLPDGVELNALGELDDVAIDLGEVISARAVLNYDGARWASDEAMVVPARSSDEIVIEYAAHPLAKLYVATGPGTHAVYELSDLGNQSRTDVASIGRAERPVKVRIVEKATGKPAAVRLHIHGQSGEYLPPRGHHRKVNPYWFEDNYAEFVNGNHQYSYVEGECIVDLPLGTVYVEMTRGYEVTPIRTSVDITPETEELRFELDRVLQWREEGWVTADTHVHFLSPQTALLEGRAEDVNVVNLLASQWGEMFSNVGDFDGRTTFGASDFGGDGEFLVRVGTENRMQVLGHISLLGYSGEMIHPLCSGGPGESAAGDSLEVTMAEWAKRCIDQKGLVVMPHAPAPQLERVADIVLGVVHAIEMMSFSPLDSQQPQVTPYGIADWYRYLNLGYHVPVVGGSDKMAASSLLGGIRTYAHLGDCEFTYENWMAAVRAGNTFVTVGPLVRLSVEGVSPGGKVNLPSTGGTVDVSWTVESACMPVEQVEIVAGGLAVESITLGGKYAASGSVRVPVEDSTWIALRVRGSRRGKPMEIAAHSSAVQVLVDGMEIFSDPEAMTVLEQVEGAIAYVDTLATRPDAVRFKQLRATLESAYNRLHQRMHAQGLFHRHSPVSLHEPGQIREH